MFDKVKGRFGFGAMRVPMVDKEFDKEKVCEMVDAFIGAGFNYFDTAHGYMEGQSERLIRECVVKRYPRDEIVLANKLSPWFFEKEEDILPMFNTQLECCGVDYFDFYLFHTLTRKYYQKHIDCGSFEIFKKLKEEGKIKHIAMSFHDNAETLDKILTEQPIIEAVQLQFNYLDYDDPTVQSKACYDVAVKHGKKVMVMEPVRGGILSELPEKAMALFSKNSSESPSLFALRFALSYPEVFMVLSGMSDIDMIKENTEMANNFKPFTEEEKKLSDSLRELIRESRLINCTKCSYCEDVCPKGIPIPELFSIYNDLLGAKKSRGDVKRKLMERGEKLGDCIECGKCEDACPQSIKIRELIKQMNGMING